LCLTCIIAYHRTFGSDKSSNKPCHFFHLFTCIVVLMFIICCLATYSHMALDSNVCVCLSLSLFGIWGYFPHICCWRHNNLDCQHDTEKRNYIQSTTCSKMCFSWHCKYVSFFRSLPQIFIHLSSWPSMPIPLMDFVLTFRCDSNHFESIRCIALVPWIRNLIDWCRR
jgi:hypothetical protein